MDLIAAGESWFEDQRRNFLSVNVTYSARDALLPRTVQATLVTGRWEAVDQSGQIVRVETRDFFVSASDLPAEPKRGDTITVEDATGTHVYEVTIPGNEKHPWRWCDRSQRLRRIHTMRVEDRP